MDYVKEMKIKELKRGQWRLARDACRRSKLNFKYIFFSMHFHICYIIVIIFRVKTAMAQFFDP